MAKTAALILAAGQGKRMKSSRPKVMQEVLFKPIIDWVMDSANAAGIGEICVVAGHMRDQLEKHLDGRCKIAVQNERLGTAHAVMQAENFVENTDPEDMIILCGDAPFINAQLIRESYKIHKEQDNALTVIAAEAPNPFGYGRICTDSRGTVTGIVEEKDASEEVKKITLINSGAYWFKTSALFTALKEIRNDNVQGEYYLTDAVQILYSKGYKNGIFKLPDVSLIEGANDRKQLAGLNKAARRRELDRLYESGVSIVDESGVIVGPDVNIGQDTLLLPGTIIRGKVSIGCGCVIGPNSIVENCEIGDNVAFNASQAYQSKIASGATIGPFCHIRPNSNLHENVHVGDFVEVKNSEVGKGTKIPHLTYVGDSDVGESVNFGCGCVTVNYDGVSKHRTKVGNHAFIGCNTNLVAPVEIGDNAYTAAGSTITKKVPDGALAVARTRQQNLDGWVSRKRPKKS